MVWSVWFLRHLPETPTYLPTLQRARKGRIDYERHHSVVGDYGPDPVGGKWGGFGRHQDWRSRPRYF
jgi:hypothetical protein